MTVRRVLVVGGGLAGATTAVSLRRLGFDGDLVLLGDESHLPYERPALSKGFLAGDVVSERLLVHPAQTYTDLSIDVRRGLAAVGLDVTRRTVQLADGTSESYDACVVATGSVNILPPIPGAGLPGVHQLRRLDDARRLREQSQAASRAVVIGMGFIGCEVAATLRQRGLDVTMVDRLPGPLWAQLGEQLSVRVQQWHEQHGVRVAPDAGVAAVEAGDDGRAAAVRLADGRLLPADLVVVGVGARPATDWLLDAALHLARGAVGVDDLGRSSAPGVYAAGDAAAVWDSRAGAHRRVEHYQAALEQGARVAATILDRARPAGAPSWFWSDQYDHVLHYAGERDGTSTVERAEPYAAFYVRGSTLTGLATIDNGRDFRRALRLLGTDVELAQLADPAVDVRQVAAAGSAPAAVASRPADRGAARASSATSWGGSATTTSPSPAS